MKKFTIQQIDDALRKVINKQPDFVYSNGSEQCYYHKGPIDNDCEGCLFGQAFQLLGVSKEELQKTSVMSNDDSIKTIEFAFLPPLVQRPRYWTTMQGRQDTGVAWGELLQFLPPIV